jgi:hypothetical protein
MFKNVLLMFRSGYYICLNKGNYAMDAIVVIVKIY